MMIGFPDMGRFAVYIWTAWGVAGSLMLVIWALSARFLRSQSALVAMLEATPEE
jgi:heme exporter protein D